MYLLNWNQEATNIEVNLGGVITGGEASVLVSEVLDELASDDFSGWDFVLDCAFARRIDPEATLEINRLRDLLNVHEVKFVCVTASEDIAQQLISQNLQAVLEGREQYLVAA